MLKTTQISGKLFTLKCADALAPQAEWLAGLLSDIEAERGTGFLKDGVRLQVGWSILTVKQMGEEYAVCEPDYDGDPFRATREDLTCTLTVQGEQNTLLRKLGVEGVLVSFQDKIVFAKNCLPERRVYLERKASEPRDSGWYIGPAGDTPAATEYEAIRVYQLLQQRPALLKVLALPVGYLVIFDGDNMEAIVNNKNERIA